MVNIVKIKKPVEEIEVIELPPKAYNVIRSFVESSEKEEYEWNKGIKLGKEIIFEKRGKWRLVVREYTLDEIRSLPSNTTVCVIDLENVLRVSIDKELSIRVTIDKYEFTLDNKVAFTGNVLFARPILLSEIMRKISEYVEIGGGK